MTRLRKRTGPASVAGLAGLLWCILPAMGQERNFHHYTTADGVPQRQVLSIAQGPAGFIWFGTFGGVSRFDGRDFKTFTTRDGLSSNTILDLALDHEGRLAAGTGQGLCHWQAEADRFECPYREGPLATAYINGLEVDRGILWVASSQGLVRVDQDGVRHYTPDDGLPHEDVQSVAPDGDDRIWVGTESGLVLLEDDRVVGEVLLAGHQVAALLPDEDGLKIATNRGLFEYRDGEVAPLSGLPRDIRGAPIATATRTHDGIEWFATPGGVLRQAGEHFEVIGEREGLIDSDVHTVFEDREGNVWFGTQAGASKLSPGPIVAFRKRHGLPHPFVRALAAADDGRLWIGTRDGVVVRDLRTKVWERIIGAEHGLNDSRIYSLAPVSGARAWIGSADGLYFFDGERVSLVLSEEDGLPASYIPSLLIDESGALWIGTAAGIRILEDGELRQPPHARLDDVFVLSMVSDGRGGLWFAVRDGGLMALDRDGELRVLDRAAGLTDQTVWDVHPDSSGRIWAASNGEGAFRVDPDGDIEQFRRGAIHDDFIWNVLVDESDRVWLFGNRGLLRFEPESGQQRLYTNRDGLADLEGSAAAAVVAGGKLWFGTGEGLVRFDPARELVNEVAPSVYLTVTRRDNDEPVESGLELPHGHAGLQFAFAATSFRDEQRVQYRYRLVGHDPVWSEPDSAGTVSYGGLDSGHYEFRVTAANSDGVWSQSPATFEFEVARPWWGYPGAWIGALVLLGLTGWGGIRLSLWRMERQRRQLKLLVAQRTRELKAKNRELEQLAITDELTGLFNRRHFMSRLAHEWELLERSPRPTPLSLVILDLDHFKEVNDSYGHQAGDRALAETARRLQRAARKADTLARYGGEEFAMVLPFTDREGAVKAARRMLDSMTDKPLNVLAGRSVRVSASIGTATALLSCRSAPGGIDELIRRADGALYEAKHSGRGRVVSAPDLTGDHGDSD